MPDRLPPETMLDRLADDVAGMIQALRLMSDMQRQQGEQLATIIDLLTPPPPPEGRELPDLLEHLVGTITGLLVQVQAMGEAVGDSSRVLPRQMAEAVEQALARAGPGGRR